MASVKVNTSGQTAASGQSSLASGRFSFINWQMKGLIMMPRRVRMQDITGPGWINTDHFDIVAEAPPNTSLANARLMLRALLADSGRWWWTEWKNLRRISDSQR